MDEISLKAELDSAYRSLSKAEDQISRLLEERMKTELILTMFVASGFIQEEKLQEARKFVNTFCN